jgi:AcrR family transcriptional regulator
MQVSRQRRTQSERRADTSRALVAAAERAFSRDGFHAASVEAIAEDAGFSKGAVYARFGGKDGLFLAVFEERYDRRLAVSEFEGGRGGATFGERLEAMVLAHQAAVSMDPAWTVAWVEFAAHATRDPELSQRVREVNDALRERTERLIVELGVPKADAAYLATVGLVYGSGVSVERMLDPSGAPASHLARMARALGRDLERGAGDG